MEEDEPKPPSPSHLSKIPSWISLGFVLGALFVWALPQREPAPAAPAPAEVALETTRLLPRSGPAQLSDIEAVFAVWGQYAVWEHDLSEVALWDTETRDFSRYYEVLRSADNHYFRSIDHLTRPILTHGVKADSPLQYTETEAMREEWLRERREEDWKAIKESVPSSLRQTFSPPSTVVVPALETTPGDGT